MTDTTSRSVRPLLVAVIGAAAMVSTGCYRHVVETNAPGYTGPIYEANVEEGDSNLFETRTVTEKRSYYID